MRYLSTQTTTAEKSPNVIYIMADDLGIGDLVTQFAILYAAIPPVTHTSTFLPLSIIKITLTLIKIKLFDKLLYQISIRLSIANTFIG